MDIFHEKFKRALKEAGISQNRLAKEIGVTQACLWVWLNKVYPPIDRLLQICSVLNVTPNDLLT